MGHENLATHSVYQIGEQADEYAVNQANVVFIAVPPGGRRIVVERVLMSLDPAAATDEFNLTLLDSAGARIGSNKLTTQEYPILRLVGGHPCAFFEDLNWNVPVGLGLNITTTVTGGASTHGIFVQYHTV